MNKFFLLPVIFLTACSSTGPQKFRPTTSVEVVTSTSYNTLPDIPQPKKPDIKKWKWDFPREVKNTEECRKTPLSKRNESFWSKCSGTPIKNGNVFVGVNQTNFNIVTRNFEVLKEHNYILRQRIELANQQRREERVKAEQETNRVLQERATIERTQIY